jgi:cell division protein FtsZ
LLKPKISIFGVGGAGGNALNNMIRSNLEGVQFIAANTDSQSLANSLAANRIQLGLTTTKGLGAGSFPDRGKAAAEENVEEIIKYLEGNNMVFITAGMGGGTGTGAAPVIAKLAKERDILTVGVVTKPFQFEGKYRMEVAELGVEELKRHVDTLIVIPNQNLFRIANEQTTFESAFKMADNVLHDGVRGVTDLITMPGLVNLDFADIRTIMTKMGKALMGTGEASGEDRAVIACEEAISNPLLDDISIRGAKGVLVNMTGGPDMTLFEADLAINTIKKEVDANANIIFGSAFNEDMKGKIRISIVATGIEDENFHSRTPAEDSFVKPKSQMVHEIREVSREKEEEVVNVAMQGKRTFFDPGLARTRQDVGTTLQLNFGKEKEDEKSEDEELEKNSVSRKTEQSPASHIGSKFDKDQSEDKDVFDRFSDSISALEKKIEQKSQIQKPYIEEKKPAKKDGGFSLFGFLNSSKNEANNKEKSAAAHHSKAGKKQNIAVEDEEEVPLAKKNKSENHPAKITKKHSIIIEDDEDEAQEMPAPKKHPVSSNKQEKSPSKHNQREDFSVGDEEEEVLNVPAFFRRKK